MSDREAAERPQAEAEAGRRLFRYETGHHEAFVRGWLARAALAPDLQQPEPSAVSDAEKAARKYADEVLANCTLDEFSGAVGKWMTAPYAERNIYLAHLAGQRVAARVRNGGAKT